MQTGPFLLEAIRTKDLIKRHIPHPPAVVLDIGGAAGAYSFWLAEAGYAVHLRDASARLIAEAKRRNRDQRRNAHQRLASCEVGDARALAFGERIADAVLLLGPLYHLTEPEGRAAAVREAARALKPGGVLLAAGISRWASALDGLSRDLFLDARFAAIVEHDIRDGQHRNTTNRLDYFTTAYFHRPQELRAELEAAEFRVQALYGIEGPGWLFSDLEERLADERRRGDLLRVAQMLESEPEMIGASAHLLAVAVKP